MNEEGVGVSERECGECSVCCTYLAIRQPDLSKPGLEPCVYLKVLAGEEGYSCGGCQIYADRPDVCTTYKCQWMCGAGNDEDRPDRCGVLIDTVLPIHNCLQAKPIRAGAADTPEGNAAIERMSRDTNKPVLVARFPETQMVRVVGRGAL